MPKRVRLRKEAEVEATEARLWYEAISDGIAAGFVRDLREALAAVATRPEAYPRYEGEQRLQMRLLRKYPYLVLYHELEDEVEVVAIAHTSRRPGYWEDRVS